VDAVKKRVEIPAALGESCRDDSRIGGTALGVGTVVDGKIHKVIIAVDMMSGTGRLD
jgi:hypothetical protein